MWILYTKYKVPVYIGHLLNDPKQQTVLNKTNHFEPKLFHEHSYKIQKVTTPLYRPDITCSLSCFDIMSMIKLININHVYLHTNYPE